MVIFHKTQKKLKNLLTKPRFFSIISFSNQRQSEVKIMSKSVYTQAMCEKMANVQPLNADICSTLAQEFGLTQRSVIAKAKSLGLDYTVKAKPAKKKSAPTKMDIVRAIEKGLDADQGSLDGLVKATAQSLDALLSNIS
tara:strand:+ start:724 stop:1140 length:417 start_codon:yes stop_codon:yes gene_type:complete